MVIALVLMCGGGTLRAQRMSDSYYRNNPSWVDPDLWARDGERYQTTQEGVAPYENFAIYGFSFVDYDYRAGERLTARLGNIELRNPLSPYPDYTLVSLLRKIPSLREYRGTRSHTLRGAVGREESFDASPSAQSAKRELTTQLATRTYRLGVGYSAVGTTEGGVGYSLAAGGRWGRDANIEGLFAEEEYLWLSGERVWMDEADRRQSLQLALMVAPTLRSQRSWNTEEVFTLAGNRHYNSYWGWQEGRVRSSRVRRECVPALYASWNVDDEYVLSNLNVSALVRGGRRTRSTLDWVDAPSPMADNYAYLPSGKSDPEVAHLAGEVWRKGDERYTQIDWTGLYLANALSTEGAHYAIVEEREDLLSGDLDASAALLGLEGGRVGVRLSAVGSHNYNLPTDLLGSKEVLEGYDLYDYSLGYVEWQLYGSLHREGAWGALSAGVEVGEESVNYRGGHIAHRMDRRQGVMRSRVAWSRRLTEGVAMGATARYDHLAPLWSEALGSWEGAAVVNPHAGAMDRASAEVWADMDAGWATFSAALYGRGEWGLSHVEHFWNDLEDRYSTLLAGGLAKGVAGVELSVEASPVRSLTLGGHCSVGVVRYMGDGVADIVAHDTGKAVVEGVRIHTKGIGATSTPLFSLALTARYFTPRGWLLGAEWAYVAGRRVEPSMVLLTDYLLERDLTPEEYEACTTQPSLGDAHSLGLFVWRKFGAVSVSMSVRNLLNYTAAYSAGYQPSRLEVVENDTKISYLPHAAKYQYIYPRYAYLTIGYEF